MVVTPAIRVLQNVRDAISGVFWRKEFPVFDAARGSGNHLETVRSVWSQFKASQVLCVIEHEVGSVSVEGEFCRPQTKH